MAAPKKGRSRRRVRKNVTYGQAHIKTSFNNTIVTLTDTEGNVLAWESAGSAGFKGTQVDPVRSPGDRRRRREEGHGARPRARRGLCEGRRLGTGDSDPLAAGRRARRDDREGRDTAGPQRLPPAKRRRV